MYAILFDKLFNLIDVYAYALFQNVPGIFSVLFEKYFILKLFNGFIELCLFCKYCYIIFRGFLFKMYINEA